MDNYFDEKTLFYIIPEDIGNSQSFFFEKTDDNIIIFKSNKKIRGFEENGKIEVFSNNKDGILYFKTIIKNTDDNKIRVEKPQEIDILQRRESDRYLINKPIKIKYKDTDINVVLENLSVGGMKILTSEQLIINEKYSVLLDFDSLNLEFQFIPTRISYDDSAEIYPFKISGQINYILPKDKIELVQYCYKKQYEMTNRG